MTTTQAYVNPSILSWARERARLSPSALASKLAVKVEKITSWENGDKYPTFKQAQTLAAKTHIPFGYLYLENPPEEPLPIPDLRTVGGEPLRRPSPELIEIVHIVLQQQQWYKEYLTENSIDEINTVNEFTVHNSAEDIVSNMKEVLNLKTHPTRGSWEEYFSLLIERIEQVGILVMRQGYLGHHSRPLSVSEFRGFAIWDSFAPIIFINQADAPSARLFTLIHELAHIWLRISGISDAKLNSQRQEEIHCNAIAAEFLVPREEFLEQWKELDEWTENIPTLKSHFHVSSWVIARRAQTLHKISVRTYQNYIDNLTAQYEARERKPGGPSYYRTKSSQISTRFSRALISETLSGKVLLRDTSNLLNIKPHNIVNFAKELGF